MEQVHSGVGRCPPAQSSDSPQRPTLCSPPALAASLSAWPLPSPSRVPHRGSQTALLWGLPRSGQEERLGQGWLFP